MGGKDRFQGRFEEVLAAARRGEGWARERIFVALAPVVAGYLRGRGSVEPDDLTSEVFVGVLRNLEDFEGDEERFRSWVFTIAYRRLLDERRRLWRRPVFEPLEDAPELPAPDDVEGAVGGSLASEQVRALCQRLVPDQRDVLLLRLLGRLTVDEIAVALGKSSGAVKSLQRRGFVAIGRIIEREGVPL
ncbi:MAG: RNA polymerase sigma factor [Acidimicrobiales bacterium]